MPTITENLQRLKDARDDIADAITAKGSTVYSSDGFEEFPARIESITGGSEVPLRDVNFYDYDGTITNSYTATEFANLTALPSNPTHSGLTAQGWNWSLSDAKTYVATYGKLNIGQMYITDDGKTRIYITLDVPERITPTFRIYLNGTAVIDWGDESATTTLTGTSLNTAKNTVHNYPSTGNYIITITMTNGSFRFAGDDIKTYILYNSSASNYDKSYATAIRKVELGTGITTLHQYVFRNCGNLETITIPNTITAMQSGLFNGCRKLLNINVPNSVVTMNFTVSSTYLKNISIPNINITTIPNNFCAYCRALQLITLPPSITTLNQYAFSSCSNLKYITLPNTITSIGPYCFSDSTLLTDIKLPTSLTTLGGYAFNNCFSITDIDFPTTLTGISYYCFQNCMWLYHISPIPEGVTVLQADIFVHCSSLISAVIHEYVTELKSEVFYGCGGLDWVKFKPTTPPVLTGSYTFNYASSFMFIIPLGTYIAYTTATNYPATLSRYICFATYQQGETLPTTSTDNCSLVWYATWQDAKAQTNPITEGTGEEVYARCTAL